MERTRAQAKEAQDRHAEAALVYLAEYAKFAWRLREARKAGIPATVVARWSGFHQPTVWRIMKSGHVPKLSDGLANVIHRHFPPSE